MKYSIGFEKLSNFTFTLISPTCPSNLTPFLTEPIEVNKWTATVNQLKTLFQKNILNKSQIGMGHLVYV